jgi:hypothetical protein
MIDLANLASPYAGQQPDLMHHSNFLLISFQKIDSYQSGKKKGDFHPKMDRLRAKYA